MKSITQGQQITHIPRLSVHHPLSWDGTESKTPRSRLVDSFNFLMGLIEEEPYPVRKHVKPETKLIALQKRETWQSDFYKDDYIDEEND